MGGAGCCDSKPFGLPCADCAFDELTEAKSTGRPVGPFIRGEDGAAESALDFSLTAADAESGISDFWRVQSIADTYRRSTPDAEGSAVSGLVDAASEVVSERAEHYGASFNPWGMDSRILRHGARAGDVKGGGGDGEPAPEDKQCCVDELRHPSRFVVFPPDPKKEHRVTLYRWFIGTHGRWREQAKGKKYGAGKGPGKQADPTEPDKTDEHAGKNCWCSCCKLYIFLKSKTKITGAGKTQRFSTGDVWIPDCLTQQPDGAWVGVGNLARQAQSQGRKPFGSKAEAKKYIDQIPDSKKHCAGQKNQPSQYANASKFHSDCEVTDWDRPQVAAVWGATSLFVREWLAEVYDTCNEPRVAARAVFYLRLKVTLGKDGSEESSHADYLEAPWRGDGTWQEVIPDNAGPPESPPLPWLDGLAARVKPLANEVHNWIKSTGPWKK